MAGTRLGTDGGEDHDGMHAGAIEIESELGKGKVYNSVAEKEIYLVRALRRDGPCSFRNKTA